MDVALLGVLYEFLCGVVLSPYCVSVVGCDLYINGPLVPSRPESMLVSVAQLRLRGSLVIVYAGYTRLGGFEVDLADPGCFELLVDGIRRRGELKLFDGVVRDGVV
jgi:hypothetical protein